MCALSVLDACCVAIRLAGLVEGMAEALRGERAGAVLQMTIPGESSKKEIKFRLR